MQLTAVPSSAKMLLPLVLRKIPLLVKTVSSLGCVIYGFREAGVIVSHHSVLLHFCVDKRQYHSSPSREQKANEASRFLTPSLIWPQSSPLHKYTLIH